MIDGTYLLLFVLVFALAVYPEATLRFFLLLSYKIQIHYYNIRLKWIAWCLYRSLCRTCKKAGFPPPGPFVYVDLWDRE